MKKKILCSILLALLIIFGAANCLAAEEQDYFIYKNANFEDHRLGELTKLFGWHEYVYGFYGEQAQVYGAYDVSEIVNVEKDGNSDNKVVKFDTDKSESETNLMARIILNWYPFKEKGVMSFSFMVENFNVDKVVSLNGNMNQTRHSSYADNKNAYTFLSVKGDKLYYQGNRLIASDLVANKWYRVDFAFDIKTLKATLYFDGVPTEVMLPSNTTNISELRFNIPKYTGDSAWYVDDIRIYEADGIVDDAIIDAQRQKFVDSAFYPGYEYVSSRATCYNYMAFRRAEGKKFTLLGTQKIFDGSKKVELPAPFYRKGGGMMAPLRYIAESYGATVTWDAAKGRVVVKYKDKTMETTPGEGIYYINGVASKLDPPTELYNGSVTCIDLDILFKFLEKEYMMEHDFLWLDQPNEFDWHMPMVNGVEIGTTTTSTAVTIPFTGLKLAVYDRTQRTFLFDRPSQEELDTAIRTTTNGQHPRLLFTAERVAELKELAKTDTQLQSIIKSAMNGADKAMGQPLVKRGLHDGKRAGYIGTVGGYCQSLAFGYLFSDDEAKKAEYKAEILRHFEHINNRELFPDWHMQSNSALGNGQAAYGLAYAYDWVDWTDEERAMIREMYDYYIINDELHAVTCPLHYHHHANNYGRGNQNLITPSGFGLMAIAMYEEDPERYNDVIRGTMRGTEGGFLSYYPNGEYDEGISYWRFAGGFFAQALKCWETAFGTTWGFIDVPGVKETATFPVRMAGATSGYAFGDGQAESAIIGLLMYIGDQTDNKSMAQYRKDFMGQSGGLDDIANWMPDTAEYDEGLEAYEDDYMNDGSFTAIMKTGWSKADTTVAFHGGSTSDPHGHVDVGSFQFDMNGVRFGMDLPREAYNLRDLGHYNKARVNEFYPGGPPFRGGHYYRVKAEGHNTVVANRQYTNIQDPSTSDSYDMRGKSEFIKYEFSDVSSFALLDMTNTNKILQSAVRGIKLDKISNIIEVQDDFTATRATDFLWSLHTYADIEIAEDGKSAILTESNQKIKATIINDCDFKFEVLPAAFDESYGTTVKPHFETPNKPYTKEDPFYKTHGQESDIKKEARKLAVRTPVGKDVKRFKLAVTFQPYVPGATPVAEYTSLELWKNNDAARQNLASIEVEGVPLKGFDPNKYNYETKVLTEKSDVPTITAKALRADVEVEIIKATTVPGTTSILLKKDGQTVGMYNVLVNNINDTTKFHNDKQCILFDFSVSNEPQPQNSAANLFDGDFATKFATDEQGGNIIMDLGSVIEGNLKLNIACLEGAKRTENFKIEYSVDGADWVEAFNGHNSGTTAGLEQFDIAKKARYVKVSFYGSSQGSWVSVTEMFVSNE